MGLAQYMVVEGEKRQAILDQEPVLVKTVHDNLEAYRKGNGTADERKALTAGDRSSDKHVESRPTWFKLFGEGRFAEAADWRAKTTTKYRTEAVAALASMIQRADL